MTASSARASSLTSTLRLVEDALAVVVAWARATRTVFSAREIRSFPSRLRIRYFASLEWSCVGSFDDAHDARSFFIIPIFFCWLYY